MTRRLALAASLSLVLGCRGASPSDTRAEPARVTVETEMPGPMRQGGREAVAANRTCESCHRAQAAEWGESLHHRANVEPTYVRSFAVEPLAFCTSCHAPEAPGAIDVSAGVSELGVGCVTCHGAGDRVLAAPSVTPKPAPHGVVRDARFTTDAACGGCHQFAFPDAMFRKSAELMQSTVRERGTSTAADIACASCHMPANGQRRDHRFRASRDPESVRSAVHVTARRLDERRVEIVLAPRALGHAFPTGDMFRRLEISAEAVGEDNMVMAEATRYLARHFENRTHGAHALRTLVADDRVGRAGAESTSVVLDVGAPARGRPIAYRVSYQRVETPRSVDDRDATIDGDIALAEGVLPP